MNVQSLIILGLVLVAAVCVSVNLWKNRGKGCGNKCEGCCKNTCPQAPNRSNRINS